MSANKSYWIKPAKKTVVPTHLVAVAVTTEAARTENSVGKTPLLYSHASVASARWRAGRWHTQPPVSARDAPSLLSTVEASAPDRGSVLVVAPVASHVLTLAGFYPWLAARGGKWNSRAGSAPQGASSRPAGQHSAASSPRVVRRETPREETATDAPIVSAMVDRGNPDIIRYHVNGRTVTWISGRQFFPQDESSLIDSCGYQLEYSGDNVAAAAGADMDPADRAQLWLCLFMRFTEWWRVIDGGPMAATPAGCAWNYVRKRLAPKTVLSCQEPDIRQLEEQSLFGGEATTWFYGPVARSYQAGPDREDLADRRPYPVELGPVDHWDVRSMYPTILATERFPTRYLYGYDAPGLPAVADMLARWCVIARCVVRTDTPDYPVRRGERVIHPTGTFPVTLTTPDLEYAVRMGHVVKVHKCVTYAAGRPFADAMNELMGQRRDADARKDVVWSMFSKLLTNSFGGRLAMRTHGWKRAPNVRTSRQWGEWIGRDADTGETRRYRSRGGLVDVWEEVGLPTRPLAACFAHLTAYGRAAMRALRAELPARSVVSQDTDGVWLFRHALTGRTPPATIPGRPSLTLRLTESSTTGRWYGPRHYRVDSGWTLAGMHDPQRWADGLSWLDSHSEVPRRTPDGKPPVWVYECQTRKRLGDIPADGLVDADGWVKPFYLNQE